jgi:metallopeptidase family M12-like protein/IPT/TIG domain-containing protein
VTAAVNRSRVRASGLLLVAALLSRPVGAAAPVPTVRAVEQGSLAMSAGGQLEERLTLSRDLASALLRVPLERSLRIADWPLSPGVRGAVTLTRHDVYAPGARVVKIVPEGEIEIPHSRLAFFWNAGEDASDRVVVSVDPADGSLHATSFSEDGVMELARSGAPSSRSYRVAALESPDSGPGGRPWTCGAEVLPPAPPTPPGRGTSIEYSETQAASLTKIAVIAIDTDNEFMQKIFADNTTNAANFIASLFAAMNVVYERDVSLRLLEGYTILRVSTTPDPYLQSGSGNADGPKLDEFGNYWGAHYGAVKRTLAAMLSGKQGGGASGIAWIGGLCSTGFGYSFNQVFISNNASSDVLIVGHEIGHNFGSPHTHCYSPPADTCYSGECYVGPTSCPLPQTINGVTGVTGTLMSYCHLIGCEPIYAFHPRTLSEYFNNSIAGASSCIFGVSGSPPPGPTVTGIVPPSGLIAGGTPVTITGTSFSANPKVAFVDLTGSVSVTVGTATAGSITATTPAHATGMVDVVVMNSDYQTGTLRNGFTYLVLPTATGVTPSFGPTAGGTVLTIAGGGFVSGASVTVGGSAATNVSVVNSSTIKATTPANSAGTADIVATFPGPLTTTLPASFTYSSGTGFFTLTPCRVLDTRNPTGPLGGPAIAAAANRTFAVAGQCGIPAAARAISANVTVTQPSADGDIRVFAASGAMPATSVINYQAGQTRANNALLSLGPGGVAVHCDQPSGTVQLILDVNGYYQ